MPTLCPIRGAIPWLVPVVLACLIASCGEAGEVRVVGTTDTDSSPLSDATSEDGSSDADDSDPDDTGRLDDVGDLDAEPHQDATDTATSEDGDADAIDTADTADGRGIEDVRASDTPPVGDALDMGLDTSPADSAEPDAGAAFDCDRARALGWQVCAETSESCEVLFEDRAGCAAVCDAVGLRCVGVYENIEGACSPDFDRPALACDPGSGHESDYCVCASPDCTGSCDGRTCGDDGCGRPCGSCGTGEACVAGACESTRRPWEDLLDDRVGFGRDARGGQGGELCRVATRDHRGPGSLRSCAESDEPRWIRFDVSGVFDLGEEVRIGSNTTIDGRGADVTFKGRGFVIRGEEHVIIHNIAMENGDGPDSTDAIQIIDGARHVWIDHVTLSDYNDGLVDITRASTDVTVSWTRFFDHDKVMLISASSDHDGDEVIRVTLHHNYFDGTTQRHPRLRWGRVHAFNNYYRHWGSYAIGASHRSQLRSQRNIFDAGSDHDAIVTHVGSDPDRGEVRSDGDWTIDGARIEERNADDVFDPRDSYPYELEEADDELRDAIRDGGGRQSIPWPE